MQRVNFYQDRFRPQRDRFSAKHGLFYLLFLLSLLFVTSVGLQRHLSDKQLGLAQQEHNKKRSVLPSPLSQDAKACHTVLGDFFRSNVRSDFSSIIPLLEQLSRFKLPGMWLTEVEISHAGAELFVRGNVLPQRSQQLFQFVRELQQRNKFYTDEWNGLTLEADSKQVKPGLKFLFRFGKKG